MTRRVLVVRSGAIPFPPPRDPATLSVVEIPSHTVLPLPAGLDPLGEPAALAIFTSQIAVRVFFEDPERAMRFAPCLANGQVAAVGDATADALRRAGVEPSIVAAGYGVGVLDRLPARLDGWRILLPCSEDATRDLPDGLLARGARLAPMVLYRKVPVPPDLALDAEIAAGGFAAFCATSPSAASWIFSFAGDAAMRRLRQTPAVALGRFTARYLESHGIERVELSAEPSFGSALDRLADLAALAGTAGAA